MGITRIVILNAVFVAIVVVSGIVGLLAWSISPRMNRRP